MVSWRFFGALVALLASLPCVGCFSVSVFRSPSTVARLWATESSSSTVSAAPRPLDANQLDFCLGYLNKHHGDMLIDLVADLSPLGMEMRKANAWSGGSMALENAEIVDLDTARAIIQVQVQRRSKPDTMETVEVNLNSESSSRSSADTLPLVPDDDSRTPIDDVVRRLARLCWITGHPTVTGKLLQLSIQNKGSGIGKLPENMYLNQVPHNRYVRQYFYDTAASAVKEAVVLCSQGKLTNRLQVISQFPEMNPSMDSYRIGTILEMARTMAISLAEENLRVRLCVQGSMGVGIFTGVPKQLNGVNKLLQLMDWQSGEGEENVGMVGDYVNFGAIGPGHVVNEQRDATGNITQYQDDVFLLIAPQSMVGTDSSIIPLLQGMVDAAGDRPVILINPDLTDKVSAAGQQNVRGRQERLDFANSFATAYHFQNIYVSGTSYFPILGAITKLRPTEPWVAHQRRDFANNEGEIYVPVLAGETMPTGEDILQAFER